jgi:xylulose-5-phosphate/fructose-6-phosphate phosphoketolase
MKTKEDDTVDIVTKTKKMDETNKPLSAELLQKIHDYWRAANYLSVGQLYLHENPLLRQVSLGN